MMGVSMSGASIIIGWCSGLTGSVESRLEGLEEVTNLIPEILERLGPHMLTPDHQRAVQRYVQQMHELTGKPYSSLYEGIKAAFGVVRSADIPDQDWPRSEERRVGKRV